MTLLIDIYSWRHGIDPVEIEQAMPNATECELKFTHFVMKQYLQGIEFFHRSDDLVSRFTMRASGDPRSLVVTHQVSVRDTKVDVYRAYIHYSQDLSIQLRRSRKLNREAYQSVEDAVLADPQFVNASLAAFATQSLSHFFHEFSDPSFRFDTHTDGTLLVSCGLPMNPLSCSISIPSRAKVLDTLEALGYSL